MARLAVALEIGRRRAGDEMQFADPSGDERLVGQLAGAHHAIDVLRDQVDRPVGHAEVDLDVRIAGMEIRQRRNDDQQRQRRADVDAKPALQARPATASCCRRARRGRPAAAPPARSRRRRPASRSRAGWSGCSSLVLEVRLQRLDQLGDGRLRHAQQVGRAGEGAGLHDADERPHGRKLVHWNPSLIVNAFNPRDCSQ